MNSELKRLRWQCRRGAKELDAVLCRYLDGSYIKAGSSEQRLFLQLLALEDDQLLAYFFAHATPETEGLKQLVSKIRSTFMD
ncbi:MAG: succinate dehydrogenase assembly factor 2 [Methylococcaceae bacterium]|nr:succinate dehydrogenase assembly factor 2 [Methylococcaceae bacterium]